MLNSGASSLMVNHEAVTSDIDGWRTVGSIDEVRKGAVVQIIADEGALKTRMDRTAAGATQSVGYVRGHAGKEGEISERNSDGNAKVKFGGGGTCYFPWDALMVKQEAMTSAIDGWRPMGSIDEVREGTVVRIIGE